MGRNIRTTLPQTSDSLVPQWFYLPEFRRQNNLFKQRQKDYDRHHRTQDLPAILDDTDVWVTTDGEATTGRIISAADTPQVIPRTDPEWSVQQNRSQLNINPRQPINTETPTSSILNLQSNPDKRSRDK